MRSWVKDANTAIIKAMTNGDRAIYSQIGEYYIVTIPPYHMAYVLKQDQIYFNLDKAYANELLAGKFKGLLDLEKSGHPENRIKESGWYKSNGKDFLKEFKGEQNAVWLDSKYIKGLEPFVDYCQESKETAEEGEARERLPVLVLLYGKPIRIVLPAIRVGERE